MAIYEADASSARTHLSQIKQEAMGYLRERIAEKAAQPASGANFQPMYEKLTNTETGLYERVMMVLQASVERQFELIANHKYERVFSRLRKEELKTDEEGLADLKSEIEDSARKAVNLAHVDPNLTDDLRLLKSEKRGWENPEETPPASGGFSGRMRRSTLRRR